jgi:FkbM family methyltransferase
LKPYLTLPFNFALKKIAKYKLRKHARAYTLKLDLRSTLISKEVYTLKVNPRDEGISTQLYALQLREPLNIYTLSQFIRNHKFDTVIDVGSNIGFFPLVEHASNAKNIVAIEPVPETYKFLVENTKHYKNITTHNIAVGSKAGTALMYVPNYRNLATLIGDAVAKNKEAQNAFRLEKTIKVKVESLKKFVTGYDHVLVRMDIEGYEKEVTKTLPKEVHGLAFELHSYILGVDGAYDLIKNLWKQGFKIKTYITGHSSSFSFLTKVLGIENAVKLYSLSGKKFVHHNPTKNSVKKLIAHAGHVFAVRERFWTDEVEADFHARKLNIFLRRKVRARYAGSLRVNTNGFVTPNNSRMTSDCNLGIMECFHSCLLLVHL